MTQEPLVATQMTIGGVPTYYCAPPQGHHPALILIHEIWGLTEHIKDVAKRLATEGYVVLAPNLFHDVSFEMHVDQNVLGEMQHPDTRDEAQKKMRALMAPIQAPGFAEKTIAKLRACSDYLHGDPQVRNNAVGVVGFCFGGTYSFALAVHDTRVQACVAFYGHPPSPEDIACIACPVLALYGEKDTGLVASLPVLQEEMHKHGKDFTAVVYPGVGHAFFNDTNPVTYGVAAAQDAWQKTLGFLSKHLNKA